MNNRFLSFIVLFLNYKLVMVSKCVCVKEPVNMVFLTSSCRRTNYAVNKSQRMRTLLYSGSQFYFFAHIRFLCCCFWLPKNDKEEVIIQQRFVHIVCQVAAHFICNAHLYIKRWLCNKTFSVTLRKQTFLKEIFVVMRYRKVHA